jgi:quinone-modifying oxidoreductase subunit QmoC
MHGLAHYAKRLGIAPKNQATLRFSQKFWDNLMVNGRVNELKLGIALYFLDGFVQGVKNALAASGLGLGMLKAKRLNPMEILGGHSIKDKSGLKAMIKKAQEIEEARISGNN